MNQAAGPARRQQVPVREQQQQERGDAPQDGDDGQSPNQPTQRTAGSGPTDVVALSLRVGAEGDA